MIKVLLSDFDDTLVNTIAPKWAQHKLAAEKYGVVLSNEKITQHWGEPLPMLVKNLYGLTESNQVDEALQYYLSLSANYPKEQNPEALLLFEQMQQIGVMTGIVTATLKTNLLSDLEILGFDIPGFDYFQGAEDTTFHKPDPRVFEPAVYYFQELGLTDVSQILYIGDSLRDYYAARDAGLRFIGIPNGVIEFPEDFARVGAEWVNNISEVYNWVLEINAEVNGEMGLGDIK